jgi:hypothetical protein
MPTVLRIGPYRFHFYSADGHEPPHIHVSRDDDEAKFWLVSVSLAYNRRYSVAELSKVESLVNEHRDFLLNEWNDHFN